MIASCKKKSMQRNSMLLFCNICYESVLTGWLIKRYKTKAGLIGLR